MKLGDLNWAYDDVGENRPRNLGDRPFNPDDDRNRITYDDDDWDDEDDDWGVDFNFDEED